MKLIYITGATSCGKSTLANKMADNADILSLDAFSKSVRSVFPDFRLYGDGIFVRPTVNNDRFLALVKKYIEVYFADYPDRTLIVEGCHFMPDEFLGIFPSAEVIALGITDRATALCQINKRGWMQKLDDEKKEEYVTKIVEYSTALRQTHGKYEYREFLSERSFQ
ncbi:MAG: hypothetical protein ACI4RU_01985 [Acutalibacteraceae bacterium]